MDHPDSREPVAIERPNDAQALAQQPQKRPSRFLRRLSRPQDDVPSRHASRLHGRHPGARHQRRPHTASAQHRIVAQGIAQQTVRSQHRRLAPGNALLRLRPMPRRILLRAKGDAVLPVGQRSEGRADRELLTTSTNSPMASRSTTSPTPKPARMSTRRSIPNSKCGARASTPAPASPAPIATCPTSAKAR